MKPSGYIVFFMLEEGLYIPYGWDEDCPGAICATDTTPVVFPDKAAARKAIRISKAYAKLLTAQGEPAIEEFLGDASQIKIMPCVSGEEVDA